MVRVRVRLGNCAIVLGDLGSFAWFCGMNTSRFSVRVRAV